MSHSADVVPLVLGVAELLRAVAEAGAEYLEQKRFQSEDGRTHEVDYVVRDAAGAEVGVKVDRRTEEATFIAGDCAGRGKALAGRITQRYAYARVTEEMRRKGYQLAKEERAPDGTVRLVWNRWR